MGSKYTILLPGPAKPQSAIVPSKTPPMPAPLGEGAQ
jgi:hypothetical protein